jgi:AAA domain, putative AbiEii toxin, Type IV TA system
MAPGSPFASVGRGETSGRVRATYSFSLSVVRRAGTVRANEDLLKFEFIERDSTSARKERTKRDRQYPALLISHRRGRVKVEVRAAGPVPAEIEALSPLFEVLQNTPISDSSLLLENPLMQPLFAGPFQDLFSSSIFSISPENARRMNVDIGKPVLDTGGANLSLVLGRLLNTPIKRKRFVRLIRALLPDVVDLRSERFGNMVMFKVREHSGGGAYFASEALSDGTLSTIALVVALFFEEKPLVIIEEPERNLHPRLLGALIDLMKEVSSERQLIVTTHSPTFVEGAGLDALFFLSRTKTGTSVLSRPSDSAAVRAFLKEEIGLGTLFSQDLLSS